MSRKTSPTCRSHTLQKTAFDLRNNMPNMLGFRKKKKKEEEEEEETQKKKKHKKESPRWYVSQP